jgi:hypothetical protein
MYQGSFIEGYALSSAWQEVPLSLIVGLCEEVRNRLLRFALEIKGEIDETGDKPADVAKDVVETAVNNFIYGGINVFGGAVENLTNIGTVVVGAGDFAGLTKALLGLEIPETEIGKLKEAIEADHEGFGKRTKKWLANAAKIVGKGGVKAGAAVGQDLLKELLLQYFDLK